MKKGQAPPQTASNVAVFVLLLGLFLAIYVLMLPPENREELLYQNFTDNKKEAVPGKVELLMQNPGLLKIGSKDEIIHKMDSINLYSKDEPKVTDLASSLYLEKSLASETKRNLLFNINDLENLETINLILSSAESNGNLIINLNGITIYDSKILGLVNIILPKDYLQEKNNKLELSVSSPGLNIFKKNAYRLTNIKIRENYELTNTRESREVALSDQETGAGKLRFFLYCNNQKIGSRLRIFLNNEEIKNEVISCTTTERIIDLTKNDLETGKNNFIFQIDGGDYIFSNIELIVKTEQKGSVNYKFPITKKEFDSILSDDKEAVLYMEFNNDEQKKAVISINGKEFSLDTNNMDYERDVSRLVKEGNNFIRITPVNEFNIDLLRITLE